VVLECVQFFAYRLLNFNYRLIFFKITCDQSLFPQHREIGENNFMTEPEQSGDVEAPAAPPQPVLHTDDVTSFLDLQTEFIRRRDAAKASGGTEILGGYDDVMFQ
jgi:hypothetical protein